MIEDIENEVIQLQSGMETSYKNNCKERMHQPNKGAPWLYPELERMCKHGRKSICQARREQLDWHIAKIDRKEYKKAIHRCKRESWSRFCSSVEGPRPAARLFRILGKGRSVDVDNIVLPNAKYASNTEEALGYLLDSQLPGNTVQTLVKHRATTHQASKD